MATDAAAHDGAQLREGLIDPSEHGLGRLGRQRLPLGGERGYLADVGKVSRIHRRKPRGKPMP